MLQKIALTWTWMRQEDEHNDLSALKSTCIAWMLRNGWVMRPIHKSEHARPPRRTFDGGWQQETFLRAAMIRAFPKNATIERGIFVTKDNIPRWSRSAVQHKASSIFVPLQTFVKFDMSFGYQPTLLISEMLHKKNVPNNSFCPQPSVDSPRWFINSTLEVFLALLSIYQDEIQHLINSSCELGFS